MADRFELLGHLGVGGGGTVFAARDRVQGRTVAIKRLRDANPQRVYHFKREFRALADVSHPNLVTLHELFVDGRDFLLSMELVHGGPLSAYLRPGPSNAPAPLMPVAAAAHTELDWGLVRATFAQLADALLALHAAGIFHRDLKPSNVLVSESGRVVVLDFGLITTADLLGQVSRGHSIVGTPAYMAPEVCRAMPYQEASDWYSVGVMLFEVLAGELPYHADNVVELFQEKVRGALADIRTLNPAVPDDLARLCEDLLQCEPAARPPGSEVRRRLGQASRTSKPSLPSIRISHLLVGRNAELSALQDAFDARTRGAPVLVWVDGVSGMGKSALVETFLARIVRESGALVLRGRCYQHEFLPYKAIDGVVDALSDYLTRLPRADAERLLPAHMHDLARVFTVAAQIPVIGSFSDAEFQEDPVAVKRRAFSALRELLVGLARERPLVVFVDDVHWGDLDSVDLLEELLRSPGAPALLLVLAFRSEERTTSPFLGTLHGRLEGPGSHLDAREVPVRPLSHAASVELTQAILAARRASDADLARRIADESEGHPLLIEELVRYAVSPERSTPAAAPAASSAPGHLLTHVIKSRIGELPARLRTLLDVVSLAGTPVTADAACRAAGMNGVDQAAIQHLLVRRFLRAHRESGRDVIASYHDRIRETAVDSLASMDRRDLHRALGNVLLRQEQVPARVLLTHFEGAGEFAIAATHALAAAEQAEQALAFNEAAELYRKVITWAPGSPDTARHLRKRLADALFNQGLCRDAAAAYAEAAEGAPASDAAALRTRAALSFMTCGAVQEGEPLMRSVLREVGVSDPRWRTRTQLHLMASLARLRLRGVGYRPRAAHEIAPELLRRIETCQAAAHAFILQDYLRSCDFLARGLLMALKAGQPRHLIEGCALLGALLASFRSKFGERLIAVAEQLADELDTSFARGTLRLARAAQHFMQDDWQTGLEHADAACQLLNRCAGVTTVQQFAEIQRVITLRSLERFEDIERASERNVRWAREVGNSYFEAAAHLESVLPLLARDDVAGARALLGEVLRASSHDGYLVHSALTMNVKCDLYEGHWQHAYDHVERHWDALRRGGMLMVPVAREFYGGLRAGVALEVSAHYPGRRDAPWRLACKGLKSLRGTQSDFGRGCRAALLAAMASVDDRIEEAVRLCGEAAGHFARASLPVRAAALERRAGELEGSATRIAQADADMLARGVADPGRWTRSVAPGFRTAGQE